MKDRTAVSIASVVGGLAVLYLLSPPFVAWLFANLGMNDSGPSILQYIYAPLVMLYENFPPYKKLMDALFKILLP